MNDTEKKQLFDVLILEIEAGDLKAIQRRFGIKSINFPLDKKITLAPDKVSMLSMSDQLGNTLLLTAANFQRHNLVDLFIHCGSDINHRNQQQDRAVDLAWNRENYDTVLLLLQNDSKFPYDFNLDELGSADTDIDESNFEDLTPEELTIRPLENRLLSRFARQRALLHTMIQQGDLTEVKRLLLNHDPATFYYNQQGQSALAVSVENNQPDIYAYLKSIGAEFRDQQEWQNLERSLNNVQKEHLRRALLPYFKSVNDEHLLYLLSKTRSTTSAANHLTIIYSYYKKLSAIPEIDKILKVLYYADTLDIVFDFEKSAVDGMIPADASDAVGLTIPSEGTIYIAANQPENTLLGTIAHEFTHYALQLLYDNAAHSHERLDAARKQQLKTIISNIQVNQQNAKNELITLINTILQDYEEQNHPAEFSVLISEILATIGKDQGIQQATTVIPELLKYYDEKILVDCEKFVQEAYLIKPKNSIRLLNHYTGDLAAIKDIPVQFNPDDTYHSFLDNGSPSNVLLVTTPDAQLSGANLYQELSHSKNYKFPNRYLWISSVNFKRLEAEIKQLFQVGDSGLLVITHPVEIEREIENLLTITSASPNKKLLIIAHPDQADPIRQLLARQLLATDYQEINEPAFTLDQLTPDSCENFLSESIRLQGKPTTIRALFNLPIDSTKSSLESIEVATVREIIASQPDLGQPLPTLTHHNDRDYRDRALNDKSVIQWSALEADYSGRLLWAISGNRIQTLLPLFTNLSLKEFTQINLSQPPSAAIVTLDEHDPGLAKQQFYQLCQHYPTKTIHWLQLENSKLRWQQSQGRLTDLREYINDRYSQLHSETSLIEDQNDKKIVIFADTPGAGKTTQLTHIAQKIKEQAPDTWVIYIRLNDYQQPFYEQRKTPANSLSTPEQAIQFLTNHLLTFQSALEKRILIDRLRHRGKTFLLVDGFDELMAESQPLAINLVKSLEKTPLEKIWITTRPHLRTLLEDQLGSIAYTLEPFSVATAGEILTQIWQGESATSDQFEKIGSYAQALIEKFTHSIKDYSADFIGQPLQIELLATAFKEKLQQFLSSTETTPTLNEKLDLATLYQQFIEKKYAIQQQEKRGAKAWDSRAKNDFNRLKPGINQDHQRVALLELFPEQTIQNLLPKPSRTPEELAEFGVIEVIQGKPRFIHRSFAEYFVADRLVDQLAATEPSTILIDLLLTDVLLKPNPAIIRAFLNDRFTQQLPSSSWRDYKTQFTALWSQKRLVDPALRDTPLQVAVAEKNPALINFFLKNPSNPLAVESSKQLLQHQDAYGKGILHQAVATADQTIVQQIIDAGRPLGILDSLLLMSDQEKRTALHVAARIKDSLITRALLTAGKPGTQATLIKAKNSSGRSALHLAVLFGNQQVVDELLPNGLDQTTHYERVSAPDSYGQCVLQAAFQLPGDKEAIIRRIFEPLTPLQRASLIGTPNQNQRNSFHEAVYYGHKTAVPLLLEQLADAATRNALLLAPDQAGKTAFYHALEQGHTDLAELLFNSVDSTTRRALLSANNLAESQLLRNAPSLLRQFQVQRELEALNALDQQIGKVGLWPVNPTSSNRCRRQLNPCHPATEPHFPYDVLTDRSVTPEQLQAAHHYAQIALAAAWNQPDSFTNSAIDDLISYQRAIGTILRIAPSDRSAREQQLVANHYQQAQQFMASNPVSDWWEPLTPGTSILPAEKQSWRFDNGKYSLLASYDGKRYFPYSSDFNDQQRWQSNENIPFSEMAKLAERFFQWRSGSPSYRPAIFKPPTTTERIDALKQAPFWRPNQVLPDRLQLAESSRPALIEGLPTTIVHDLFYLKGETPSPDALQANFFQHGKTDVQLRVDQLSQLLPELTESQRQTLTQLAKSYQWPATMTLPTDLPAADKLLFEAYQQQVLQALRQQPITLEQLSALSWQLLQEHFDRYPEIPVELRDPAMNTLRAVHTTTQRSWAKTAATQTLFFLPDLIRAANTGNFEGLERTTGMLLGDLSVNLAYTTLIEKLAPQLPAGRAQLLRNLPVTSPIFKVMTIHSVFALHQELNTLPSNSARYQTVQHQLHEQKFTLVLMVGECFGLELGPLWLLLSFEQLNTGASDFLRENHITFESWDTLATGLGFEEAKLQQIFKERQSVETYLAVMDAINAQAATPCGGIIINLPQLEKATIWKNITVSKIPSEIRRKIEIDHAPVAGFQRKLINPSSLWFLASRGYSPPASIGQEIYWQQEHYSVRPQTITLRFAAVNNPGSTRNPGSLSMIPPHPGVPLPIGYPYVPAPRCPNNNYFLEQPEGNYTHYQRLVVATNDANACSDQPLKITGTDLTALYVNKLTFANPAAQRTLFLAFDPRLGNMTLHWEHASLNAFDKLNRAHNADYPTQLSAAYPLTLLVTPLPYPDHLIFPAAKQRATFSLIDDSQRLEVHYLITPQLPVYLNDTLPTLRVTFMPAANRSVAVIGSDTTEPTIVMIRPFNASAASESQLLLAGKHTINLNLQGMVIDTELKFAARRLQLDNVQGRSASLSQISLEPSVKSFTITLLGNITLKSPTAQLSVNTILPLNLRPMHYIGVVREPNVTLHRLEVSDLAAVRQLLSQNGSPALSWIATDPTASLAIVGPLNGTAAVLTVNPSDETLTLFNHRRQPVRISTLHPTANITVEATLRFTSIGNTTANNMTHPLILEKLPGASLGNTTILRFQASSGYPVYHLLPATQQPLRLNGIPYRLQGKQLYAAPDLGTLEARQLIQANTPSEPSIPLYFATALLDSNLTLTQDTLTINDVTLLDFPNNSLINFANGSSGFPLRVLKETAAISQTNFTNTIRRRRSADNSHSPATSAAGQLRSWPVQLLHSWLRPITNILLALLPGHKESVPPTPTPTHPGRVVLEGPMAAWQPLTQRLSSVQASTMPIPQPFPAVGSLNQRLIGLNNPNSHCQVN